MAHDNLVHVDFLKNVLDAMNKPSIEQNFKGNITITNLYNSLLDRKVNDAYAVFETEDENGVFSGSFIANNTNYDPGTIAVWSGSDWEFGSIQLEDFDSKYLSNQAAISFTSPGPITVASTATDNDWYRIQVAKNLKGLYVVKIKLSDGHGGRPEYTDIYNADTGASYAGMLSDDLYFNGKGTLWVYSKVYTSNYGGVSTKACYEVESVKLYALPGAIANPTVCTGGYKYVSQANWEKTASVQPNWACQAMVATDAEIEEILNNG